MQVPEFGDLVSDEFIRSSALVRFLPQSGGSGRLTMFAQQHQAESVNSAQRPRLIGTPYGLVVAGWYGLSICLDGSGELLPREGIRPDVHAGTLLRFTDRQHGMVWRRLDELRELVLCVDAATGQALADLGFWPSGDAVATGCVSRALVQGWIRLHRQVGDLDIPTADLMRRIIDLLQMAWSSMESAGDAAFLAKARQYLSDDLGVGAGIPQAARSLGLSERQFRRRFLHATGMAPHAYRRQLRFERACRLLADHPVAEVASRLGYADASTFSRQFSSVMGMAPAHFRHRRS